MGYEPSSAERRFWNGTAVPPVMLGTGTAGPRDYQTMLEMVESALGAGCWGFDTSPSYGSEEFLGKALQQAGSCRGLERGDLFVADKVDGWQMFSGNGEVEKYVDQSLKSLGLEYLDLLLVHWPFAKYLAKTWSCLERLYRKGKTRSIGLCNSNARILDGLLTQGVAVKPHLVQNEITPLRTCTGEITLFQSQEILVASYSPLCRMIDRIKDSEVLARIGGTHAKSIAQVVLRWHLERGVIPVFTSTKAERVQANMDIFDFRLADSEVRQIESLNEDYKLFPESFHCPGY